MLFNVPGQALRYHDKSHTHQPAAAFHLLNLMALTFKPMSTSPSFNSALASFLARQTHPSGGRTPWPLPVPAAPG